MEATCDPLKTSEWSCPPGSRPYARAPDSPDCRPFGGAIGAWGLGGVSRVPTDDGRCWWIADGATLSDGTQARNVAFLPDPAAPFGSCPSESLVTPTPVVTLEGGDDPSIYVQIRGGYLLAGVTRVVYRMFQVDPTSSVGLKEIGGGLGRWDPGTQHIVVPSPASPSPWGLDLDLGDAILPEPDGAHAFVFGCAQPGLFLEQGCELARLDASNLVELWSTSGTWIPSTDASQGATLFGSGTWASSVTFGASGLLHVFIEDYGTTLETHVAPVVTGPWSSGPSLGGCRLPADDPHAFCGGATVHEEISDPTRPGELAITYAIGTTGTPTSDPGAYAARLVWAR